jgi:acyl-coenzyme A synthetase/AMP-(fatty) acid ligase
MIDFVDMIFFLADASPEKPAVITGNVTLTYSTLRQAILSLEKRLRHAGLKAGDCVALHAMEPAPHVALISALWRLRIASVSIEEQQVEWLDDVVVDALLTGKADFSAKVRTIFLEESWFTDKSVDTEESPPPSPPNEDAVCRYVLSPGATNRPDLTGLTFRAVNERLVSCALRTSTPSWDRLVCVPALSTSYGFSFAIVALWLGRTVCCAYETAPRELVLAHQAELLVASTHQIVAMLRAQDEYFLRMESLRAVHILGSVAYAPLQARIRMLICPNVICGYGSTEGGVIAYAPTEMIFGRDRAVGVVAPWIDLEVTDENGAAVDYGSEGQVRLHALGQGHRYRKVAPSQYEVEESEWLHPGDQGILYRNGLLMITGRTDDLIGRGGQKISPETLEEAVKKHPIVADAAVVGLLDQAGIEQVWVAVVSRGGEIDAIKMYEYFRENQMMFMPDRFFEVPSIPRDQFGKVLRGPLAEHLKTLESNLALAMR